jgi:hypothetical protein
MKKGVHVGGLLVPAAFNGRNLMTLQQPRTKSDLRQDSRIKGDELQSDLAHSSTSRLPRGCFNEIVGLAVLIILIPVC